MSRRLIEKARLTLIDEIGTIYKSTPQDVEVALAYPNTYWVGMSCLGFHTIYRILNQRVDTLCERVFLPEDSDLPEYIRTNTPLFTLEHQRPIKDLDIVAFSLYFEEDYLRVLKILDLAKIPLKSDERDGFPLIIGGGPLTYSNPEPIVPFFDLFILGEAEEVVDEFISVFREAKELRLTKTALLDELSMIDGVYVPQKTYSPEELKIRQTSTLDFYPVFSSILTPHTEFGDRYLIEITRGCPHGCRFCMLKFITHPFRCRSPDLIYEEAVKGLEHTKRIGFIGSGEGNYPNLEGLIKRINEKGGEVSLGSLRPDVLKSSLLESLTQWTLSVAPEAGSERLRESIGKGISDEEILKRLKTIPHSIPNLKLYFMIGLPGEDEEDIKAIIKLTKRIKESLPTKRLTVSISPFIPKPHTPFQWRKMEDEEALEDKIQMIKKELGQLVRIITKSIRGSIFQAILARGDRRISQLLYTIHKQNINWRRALVEEGIDPKPYLEGWGGYEAPLPWDHIPVGPPKAYLIDQDRRS